MTQITDHVYKFVDCIFKETVDYIVQCVFI